MRAAGAAAEAANEQNEIESLIRRIRSLVDSVFNRVAAYWHTSTDSSLSSDQLLRLEQRKFTAVDLVLHSFLINLEAIRIGFHNTTVDGVEGVAITVLGEQLLKVYALSE